MLGGDDSYGQVAGDVLTVRQKFRTRIYGGGRTLQFRVRSHSGEVSCDTGLLLDQEVVKYVVSHGTANRETGERSATFTSLVLEDISYFKRF